MTSLDSTLLLTAIRELAADLAPLAPSEVALLEVALAALEQGATSAPLRVLGSLATLRARLLTSEDRGAADLWEDAVVATEALRGPSIDAFAAAPLAAQAAALARLGGIDPRAAAAGTILETLARPELLLAAAGDFKRGKSTVLNALLGDAVLPTRVAPATAVPCLIRAAPLPEARVLYADGRPAATIPLADLERYACLPRPSLLDDMAFDPAIVRVEIGLPWPLPDGLLLVDLPGLNEESGRAEMAQAVLARADSLLVVLSATQLLAEDEMQFLATLWAQGHRSFTFVINYRDRLDAREVPAVLERASLLLAPYTYTAGGEGSIFLVGARDALAARMAGDTAPPDSGFPDLEAHLRALASMDRPRIWRVSRMRQALDALERVEWDHGRAALAARRALHDATDVLQSLLDQQADRERHDLEREADAEHGVWQALQALEEHERIHRSTWETLDLDLRERFRREAPSWVYQGAREWLRGALIAAIRIVNPAVTPRPEGYLRIGAAPGLRLGRDTLLAFYQGEARREWARFTGAAGEDRRRELEGELALAQAALPALRLEARAASEARAAPIDAARASLVDAERVLAGTLPPALAAAGQASLLLGL